MAINIGLLLEIVEMHQQLLCIPQIYQLLEMQALLGQHAVHLQIQHMELHIPVTNG